MNEYYKEVPSGDMFDFEDFYDFVVSRLPSRSRVAEVGLANGRSLLYLAARLSDNGGWDRFVGIDSMAYGGQDQRNEIMNNVIRSGMSGIEIYELSSLDASCKYPDNYFNFVFLDSSHRYEQTKAEILLWQRKVIDGGILAGHDYNNVLGQGKEVFTAVNEMIGGKVLSFETRNGFTVWYVVKSPK